ncbi:MAG: hypothetical protein ACKVQU_20410 [Burkholderiales bacterium]
MATLKEKFEEAGVGLRNFRDDPGSDVTLQRYIELVKSTAN